MSFNCSRLVNFPSKQFWSSNLIRSSLLYCTKNKFPIMIRCSRKAVLALWNHQTVEKEKKINVFTEIKGEENLVAVAVVFNITLSAQNHRTRINTFLLALACVALCESQSPQSVCRDREKSWAKSENASRKQTNKESFSYFCCVDIYMMQFTKRIAIGSWEETSPGERDFRVFPNRESMKTGLNIWLLANGWNF